MVGDEGADGHQLLHVEGCQVFLEIVGGGGREAIDVGSHRHCVDVEVEVFFLAEFGHHHIGDDDLLQLVGNGPVVIAEDLLGVLHDNGAGAAGIALQGVFHRADQIQPTDPGVDQKEIFIPGVVGVGQEKVVFAGQQGLLGGDGKLLGNLAFSVGFDDGAPAVLDVGGVGIGFQVVGQPFDGGGVING
ncbi:MAG: hypothetical protein ACD_74C00041G0001, partial [uncultured bacterium]